MRKWKCTICGHIPKGEEPPSECPECGSPKNKFIELDSSNNEPGKTGASASAKDQGSRSASGGRKQADSGKSSGNSELPAGPVSRLLDLLVRKHLHPISVHFPNGILPAAVLFLFLAIVLDLAGLAARPVLSVDLSALHDVAFLNLVFVVLAMPVVLFSGFLDWKKRFRGIMTKVIRTKIICGFIVLILGVLLVVWRLVFPIAVTASGPITWLYFLVNAGMLVAAGIAGNLGGRLVFGKK